MKNIKLDYEKIKGAVKNPQSIIQKNTFYINTFNSAMKWFDKFHTVGHKKFNFENWYNRVKYQKGFYKTFVQHSFYHLKKK